MKVQRNSATPMYRQIANDLQEKIHNQTYAVGEQLPTEPELMKYYDVSRITIRKAINLLVEDRLITIQRGKGMFVNAPLIETDVLSEVMNVQHFKQFYDTLIEKGIDVDIEFLSFNKTTPPSSVAKALNCSTDDNLYTLSRIFYVRDLPIAYHMGYASPYVPEYQYILDNIESISFHEMIENYFTVQEIKCMLKIVKAPEHIAEKINVPPGYPLLTLSRTFIDNKGLPFITSLIYLTSDSYEFTIKNQHR
ncbi:MAG TPA: GntR family transcriptional regulator [Virgibacillus sp.]|nr:GntR family transcriptional regulator [Virgibacillus sp.]HLR69227.1 GntR family transcriptional regulator [Virgibacillus sp.]